MLQAGLDNSPTKPFSENLWEHFERILSAPGSAIFPTGIEGKFADSFATENTKENAKGNTKGNIKENTKGITRSGLIK